MRTPDGVTQTEIDEAHARIVRPLGEAEGLPGRFYTDDFYQIERARLFPRSWCAVTVGTRIPNPGDMITVNLAEWPILLVRGKDGVIRAFHNVCRHRGIALVAGPQCRPLIRCPWHSWTYNLQGDLVATPEIGGAGANEAAGIDKARLGLKPIAVGQWHDLVFVNIDGLAPPFATYIAPVDALLAEYRLESLAHAMQVDGGYEGNWKLAMEGGLEHYHLTFAHPQLGGHAFRNATTVHAPGCFAGSGTDVLAGFRDSAGRAWAGTLPPLPTRDGRPLPRLYTLNLFPTATVLVADDQFMLGYIVPDGALRSRFELHIYVQPEAAALPRESESYREKLQSWHDVIAQDKPFVVAAQHASASRDQAGVAVRFSPYWEDGVRRFQQMVLEAV